MRDPIDWILSWFRYRKGNNVEDPLPADMEFADFWKRADWNVRSRSGLPYLQSTLFCDDNGTVLADMILPYHSLGESFGQLADALGIESDLPRENVSSIVSPGVVPEDLLAEMRDFYASDYAIFDRLEEINASALSRLRARAGGH